VSSKLPRMHRKRREYERRVNRVVDYMERNPATELSLERLARLASFSPYHFHRVFKAITGETLFGFSQRLRIEKGARALLASRDKSVLDAAQTCGFASAATFARAFKAHFGMSATEWRAGGHRRWRERTDRNIGNAFSKASKASRPGDADTVGRVMIDEASIRVCKLPSYRVAYLRHVGPYGPKGIPQLWRKLASWRTAHGLDATDAIMMGVAYDDPRIAAAHACRYDACVTVPRNFPAARHVNVMDTASGRYAVCQFSGTAAEIVAAWDRAFSKWLPDSGFEPDDKPCIELFGSSVPDPPRPLTCELCLPVRPL
jgi:AraC family transcriptional regulator